MKRNLRESLITVKTVVNIDEKTLKNLIREYGFTGTEDIKIKDIDIYTEDSDIIFGDYIAERDQSGYTFVGGVYATVNDYTAMDYMEDGAGKSLDEWIKDNCCYQGFIAYYTEDILYIERLIGSFEDQTTECLCSEVWDLNDADTEDIAKWLKNHRIGIEDLIM